MSATATVKSVGDSRAGTTREPAGGCAYWRNGTRLWSARDDRRLQALHLASTTIPTIAAILDRSLVSVVKRSGYLRTLGWDVPHAKRQPPFEGIRTAGEVLVRISPRRREILYEFIVAGGTDAEIAARVGSTASAVATALSELRRAGLDVGQRGRVPKAPEARERERRRAVEAAIAELWRAGMPYKEIGVRLGIEVAAVDSALKRMRRAGVDLGERGMHPRRQEMLRLARAGATNAEIAARVGVTEQSARNALSEMKSAGIDIGRSAGAGSTLSARARLAATVS